jgi:hypothetical protein
MGGLLAIIVVFKWSQTSRLYQPPLFLSDPYVVDASFKAKDQQALVIR